MVDILEAASTTCYPVANDWKSHGKATAVARYEDEPVANNATGFAGYEERGHAYEIVLEERPSHIAGRLSRVV